jgi:Asp/Glu/hydantoin racemase
MKENGSLERYNGFLVACYSQHPLVSILKEQDAIKISNKAVTGIFEASVATSLQLIHPAERFGIVSTGKVWEAILTDAVEAFLGRDESKRFAGVETTGLNATELHDAPQDVVERKVKEATSRLLKKGQVGAICLGCAGMSGMDDWVRVAAIEELGEEAGARVRVVDGVKAGVAWLEGAIRM